MGKVVKNIRIVYLITAVFLLLSIAAGCARSPEGIVEYNALIIDEFSEESPNPQFTGKVEETLRAAGYRVDICKSKSINVEYYRGIAAAGHNLMIFRAHSGALRREGNREITNGAYLLTTEEYSKNKYAREQLDKQLAITRISDTAPYVFAVGSRFIQKSVPGTFQGTVVIMMGCASLYFPDMAEAFIKKGASVYIGWDASLLLDYADSAALVLLENLVKRKMTVKQAVEQCIEEVGIEPVDKARLKFYPETCRDLKLEELLR